MMPSPQIINDIPNIENTIPISTYQASSPEKFSLEDDDKFVLYAGGENYKLQVSNDMNNIKVSQEIKSITDFGVSIFVLNTNFIIWCDDINKGIMFPYQSIILHALKKDSLYLQIVSNKLFENTNESSEFTSSVEIEIHFHDSQKLKGFPSIPNDIHSIYEAMNKCSSFHFDEEDMDDEEQQQQQQQQLDMPLDGAFQGFDSIEQQQAIEIPSNWVSNDIALASNQGDADDLEASDENQERELEAGMNVDIGYGQIAGSIRKREEEEPETRKRRL